MRGREQVGGRSFPVAITLTSIVALSAALRIVLGSLASVPTIFHDELGFWELGRGIGESGQWSIGGQPVHGFTYGPLYPLLTAPTHLVTHSLIEAYALVKTLNAVVMSLAAVPAYVLARRVRVNVRGSLACATLAVLVPSFVYTTHVMSESLSYPLFLCAVLSMTVALERPSLGRQLVALAVIALTALTRVEMIVLFPAFACAILLLAWMESRAETSPSFWRRLSTYKWTWFVYGAGGVALLIAAVGGTREIFRSAGLGDGVPTGLPSGSQLPLLFDPVRFEAVPTNVVRHVAELDVYSGVIPFAAFVLVTAMTLRIATADQARANFVVLSLATAVWLIALAALYETSFKLYGVFATHVFDRYVFYLVPLFVIALVVWVEDGLPRPRRTTVVTAITAATLPLALPLDSLLTNREWGTCTCTVGMVPLFWTKLIVGSGWPLKFTLLVFTSTLAICFLATRGDRGWRLVRISSCVFVVFTILVNLSNQLLSNATRRDVGRNSLAWVDQSVPQNTDVAILWRGDNTRPQPDRLALREAEFFNRSIGPVYDLQDRFAAGFPSTKVSIRNGRVVTTAGQEVHPRFVLADRSLGVVGHVVARDGGSGLVLYRVTGPVRLSRTHA